MLKISLFKAKDIKKWAIIKIIQSSRIEKDVNLLIIYKKSCKLYIKDLFIKAIQRS